MAEIVLGFATSHGPMLNTPPEEWGQRARADERNPALIYRGKEYTYPELRELRASEGSGYFRDEITLDVWKSRHAQSRAAIDRLGEIVRGADLDVLVVFASDHGEVFGHELLPQFAVYWGDTVEHVPYTQAQLDGMPPGLAIAEVHNQPTVTMTRQTDGELGLHLIHALTEADFDVAASKMLPAGEWENHSIPHGWGFIIQQIFDGVHVVPIVPIFVNTFIEPNRPSASRAYDFGLEVAKAIKAFPKDLRVGIAASGGLSHMVIEEDLDAKVVAALKAKDEAYLRSLPRAVLRSGTSEIANYAALAATVADTPLAAEVIDYVPCYRSEAGTGTAQSFMVWR